MEERKIYRDLGDCGYTAEKRDSGYINFTFEKYTDGSCSYIDSFMIKPECIDIAIKALQDYRSGKKQKPTPKMTEEEYTTLRNQLIEDEKYEEVALMDKKYKKQ